MAVVTKQLLTLASGRPPRAAQDLSALNTQRIGVFSKTVIGEQRMDFVDVLGTTLDQCLPPAHECVGLADLVGWHVAFWQRIQPKRPRQFLGVNAISFLSVLAIWVSSLG